MEDYLKEGHGGAVPHSAILNFGLFGQVVCRVDGRVHPLHGEEGSQVGSVRGDYDQCEKPPDPTDDPRGQGFGHQFRSCAVFQNRVNRQKMAFKLLRP